jgi:hypothetical protein
MSDDFRDFPVATNSVWRHMGVTRFTRENRGQTVFSDRMATGFSGLIVVTIILLAVQLVSGIEAFPL